jgi:hypothetical protein
MKPAPKFTTSVNVCASPPMFLALRRSPRLSYLPHGVPGDANRERRPRQQTGATGERSPGPPVPLQWRNR